MIHIKSPMGSTFNRI